MPESVLLLLIDAEILFKVEYNNITQSPLYLPILECTSAKVLPWLWSGIEPEIFKFPACVSRFGWNPGRTGFGSWARTGFWGWGGARFRGWARTGFWGWAR